MTRGVMGSGKYTLRDEPKKYYQNYYQKNKKRILAKQKILYDANPDKFRERSKKFYQNLPDGTELDYTYSAKAYKWLESNKKKYDVLWISGRRPNLKINKENGYE